MIEIIVVFKYVLFVGVLVFFFGEEFVSVFFEYGRVVIFVF